MKLVVPKATEYEYRLLQTDILFGDNKTETYIKIKEANTGEVNERADMFASFVLGSNSTHIVTIGDVEAKEAYLTMVACDLEVEDGVAMFPVPMDESEFRRMWDRLPVVIANEIIYYVRLVNQEWNIQNEQE